MNRIKIISGRSIRNSISDSVTQLDQTQQYLWIHWREYTLEELIQLLEITGFSIKTYTYSHTAKTPTSSFIKKIFYANQ